MKLRNKKTGEIIEWFNNTDGIFPNSLAELNEEWEDVEEPKESEYYWYIGYKNDIRRTKYHHISDFADNQVTATRKEIGNCFKSLEEAEKAVERLRAWKRLKDKGIRFTGYDTNYGHYRASFIFEKEAWATETEPDLDLLFSQEDD